MRIRLAIVILMLAHGVCVAQDEQDSVYLTRDEFRFADDPRYTMSGGTPRRTTVIEPISTIALGAAYTGLFVFLNYQMSNSWWQRRAEFRVIEDGNYALYGDKAGHAYSGYASSTLCGDLLMECGFDYTTSTWLGAAMGLSYMTYVEVQDGHGYNWGFSPSDAIANTVGSALFVTRNLVPFAQNFMPRWSYIPAKLTGDPQTNGREVMVFDDYNSALFWVACNVDNLLPEGKVKELWPDWLMLSVGYGLRNYEVYPSMPDGILAPTPLPLKRRFLVGLDYNWVKIIPEAKSVRFLNYLRQALNYFRLPGPTLEFGDDGVKFGVFYPFAIVVPF